MRSPGLARRLLVALLSVAAGLVIVGCANPPPQFPLRLSLSYHRKVDIVATVPSPPEGNGLRVPEINDDWDTVRGRCERHLQGVRPELSRPRCLSVYFFFGTVNPKVAWEADKLVHFMRQIGPGAELLVDGHCDRVASTAYNLHLSELRRQAVIAALMKYSTRDAEIAATEETVIRGAAYGETLATVPETASVEERLCDRRADICLEPISLIKDPPAALHSQ